MVILRRVSQIVFLALFLVLFLMAVYPYDKGIDSGLFLRFDPLAGLSATLAARRIIPRMLPGLLVVGFTFLIGRFFCGWICPLGSCIDGSDAAAAGKKRNVGNSSILKLRWLKYGILIAVLTAAAFSFQLSAYLDPIPLLTRTLTVLIYPVLVFFIDGFIGFLFSFAFLEGVAFKLYDSLSGTLLPVQSVTFQGSVLIGLMFIAILAGAAVQKRFWCRNLCPLGALLGLLSRWRTHRRVVSEDCTNCSLCYRQCRMGAIGLDFKSTNQAECINCMDCQEICPENAIRFKFGGKPAPGGVDIGRRRMLGAGFAGLAAMALLKMGYANTVNKGKVVRPPGALPENEFLDRCIRCGECVRICASSGAGLQFIGLDSGWEGLCSPALVTPMGYCEYHCNLCGQVCPTGAIEPLTIEGKHVYKMGTAHFDKTRCIPWYYGENCMVCEEHCPIPDKAIRYSEQMVTTIDGKTASVLLPYVEESLCIGCGICTSCCPLVGSKGIFLTAEGEAR